jgi:hypothetical protein
MSNFTIRRFACLVVPFLALVGAEAGEPAGVKLQRVPQGGIQPQVVVDARGIVHLIYFRGEARGGDGYYVRSTNSGASFSKPIRVNSQPGSVIAVGSIRGAHLAIGKNGRAHVAWMGSGEARPRGPSGEAPMLYARLNDEGNAFEPQRNVIRSAFGLDGGGSVSADAEGNVYVAWHAPGGPGIKGEGNRRVWVAHSQDEGKTFAAEKPVSAEDTGVCGCCGMRAFADQKGILFLLYRSANKEVHRDTYLLTSTPESDRFRSTRLHTWNVGICPMSSFALAQGNKGILAGWETDGQVYYTRIDPASGKHSEPVAAPGPGKRRKHPVLASNARGETILAWTEGTGWNRGGAVAWQVFDREGKPTAERGRRPGVPVWSLVAVFARPDGGFTVLY